MNKQHTQLQKLENIQYSDKLVCHRPWTGFELYDHLGDVRPCCWGKISCGNINHQSKEEIWNGEGFNYYRQNMLKGNYESICRNDCPILNGTYKEITYSELKGEENTSRTPEYMRVVPSISCDLKCTMCYQILDPPVRLPTDLFEILTPWLNKAIEFQILGGEPFLARRCLVWIERLDPKSFPNLRLAAITNGLHFSLTNLALIKSRKWSWIHISVDAASESVYTKVRGADFGVLLENVKRLIRTRSTMEEGFEIRLGFTIQRSNVYDLRDFVELCHALEVIPQFDIVFGDWHGESIDYEFLNEYLLPELELLDKTLYQYGFSNKLISPVFQSIKQLRKDNRNLKKNEEVNLTELELVFLDHNLDKLKQELSELQKGNKEFEVIISLNLDFIKNMVSILETLKSFSVSYRIKVPWSSNGTYLSVLDVADHVKALVNSLSLFGWQFKGGYLDFNELGLNGTDLSPVHRILLSKQTNQPKLSVISSFYNQKSTLSTFINSLENQKFDPFELIIIDDGSTDDSVRLLSELLQGVSFDFVLLTCDREQEYVKGTYSFRAGLARQLATQYSRAERLLFLDTDQLIDKMCLYEHDYYGSFGFDVIIGDRYEVDSLSENKHWSELRTKALANEKYWWLSFYTGNSSVKRESFDLAGGFDKNLQYWGLDDTDLAYRISLITENFWHTPRSVSTHLSNSSGGGNTEHERLKSNRFHMEVLFRKYLDFSLLDAFAFTWNVENQGGKLRCSICNWIGNEWTTFKISKSNKQFKEKCPSCECIERERIQWLLIHEYCNEYIPNLPKLLEVGGTKRFSDRLKKKFDYTNLDIVDGTHVDFLLVNGKVPLQSFKADVLIISYVLCMIESSVNRIELLSELRRLSNDSATLILFEDLNLERDTNMRIYNDQSLHLMRFGQELLMELKEAGWITRIRSISSSIPDYYENQYLECKAQV